MSTSGVPWQGLVLQPGLEHFKAVVNSDKELKQDVRIAYSFLHEHRLLLGGEMWATLLLRRARRCSSTFAGNRVLYSFEGNLLIPSLVA